MKTRLLIVFLFVSLIGTFVAGATDNIPINSVEKLTESQQKTLKYTQKLLNELDNKISLPIEIYAILGDTNKRVAPKATPLWKKASIILILPTAISAARVKLPSENVLQSVITEKAIFSPTN